jgi:vanillate/3-O-methylgallate O-demethylase
MSGATPTSGATPMSGATLEDRIQEAGGPVALLRGSRSGAYVFPIPAEYTNWRDEQRAWRTTAVLFDQSFHMTDIYFEGPDVPKLFSDLGVNTFQNFGRNRAKQFVACNHDGYVIGDGILFGLEANRYNLVGRPSAPNWVAFNAEAGDYDVTVTRDVRSLDNNNRRLTFRYQVQGPTALEIVQQAHGGPLGPVKPFHMIEFSIAGHPVRGLSHTMSGFPGLEVHGAAEHAVEVKDALLAAGADFGLLEGGARAYATTPTESGWIASPAPAIYSGDEMKPYRQWLPAAGWEANASLGGSFVSERIEDYYRTPWDLGYGKHIRFDHDFVGRAALEALADRPHRRKVFLRWHRDDVLAVLGGSLFGTGGRAKYLEFPSSTYATLPFDSVLAGDRLVGVSTGSGYSVNVGDWSSLAMLDEAEARDGAEVTVVWGEPAGGPRRPVVEDHALATIRATVSTTSLVR